MGGNKQQIHVKVQTLQLILRFQSDRIWLLSEFSVDHHEDEGRKAYAKSSYLFTNPHGLISRLLDSFIIIAVRISTLPHIFKWLRLCWSEYRIGN